MSMLSIHWENLKILHFMVGRQMPSLKRKRYQAQLYSKKKKHLSPYLAKPRRICIYLLLCFLGRSWWIFLYALKHISRFTYWYYSPAFLSPLLSVIPLLTWEKENIWSFNFSYKSAFTSLLPLVLSVFSPCVECCLCPSCWLQAFLDFRLLAGTQFCVLPVKTLANNANLSNWW